MQVFRDAYSFFSKPVIHQPQPLAIEKMTPDAIVPHQAYLADAGFDLHTIESGVIEPGTRRVFKTGLKMEIPYKYYGRIAPRSGLAINSSIDIAGGVVDRSYRGEILICLVNNSSIPFYVEKYAKIAQLIIEKISIPEIIVVDSVNRLTDRGENGFGSTGM